MNSIKLYLGLDVHKNSIVVATALNDGSDAQHYGKWVNESIVDGQLHVYF